MDMSSKQSEIKQSFDETRVHFINSELDLAATFCRVAISSSSNTTSDRNAQNARKAYSAARHFLSDSNLTKAERRDIEEKIELLDSLLKQLRQRPRAER